MVEKVENRIEVPVSRIPAFVAKIKKMNSKIEKIGGRKISYSIVREFEKEFETYKISYVEFEIDSEPFGLIGWNFIAKLEHHDDGRVTVYELPGFKNVPVDAKWQTAKSNCEHCKKQMFRHNTYLLQSEATGQVKQVGSSCLRDFFNTDPKRILQLTAWYCSIADDSDDEYTERSLFNSRDILIRDKYLELVAVSVRKHGWVSKATSHKYFENSNGNGILISTADDALTGYWSDNKEVRREFEIEDQDREFVKNALNWLKTTILPKANKSSYESNLVGACLADMISDSETGIVASLISVYAKAVELEIIKRREKESDGGAIGKVGERLKLKATVTMVKSLGFGQYGESFLVKLMTENNNTIVWFGNGNAIGELIIGESVNFKATVKKHEFYNGINQTVVSRLAVI